MRTGIKDNSYIPHYQSIVVAIVQLMLAILCPLNEVKAEKYKGSDRLVFQRKASDQPIQLQKFADRVSKDLSSVNSMTVAPQLCAMTAQAFACRPKPEGQVGRMRGDCCPTDNSQPFSGESALRHEISEEEAIKLFNLIKEQGDIAFERPESANCFGRAHKMAKFLEGQGVYSRKVFVYGDTTVQNPFVSGDKMNWTSHVASVVRVRRPDGSVVDKLIDPSLFFRPASLDEWLRVYSPKKCVETVDVTRAPRDKCVYEFTERFTFNGANSPLKERNWCPDDLERAEEMMNEDLPASIKRRKVGPTIHDPMGSGRIVPNGNCYRVRSEFNGADIAECSSKKQ